MKSSDIPFAKDDAHRLLPAMVGCLIGFAALLLAVALSVNSAIGNQSDNAIGMLQVEVPRNKADDRTLTAIEKEIAATKGVSEVTLLTTSQIEALLKPWLGSNFALGDLPLPAIFDVKTAVADGKTTVDIEGMKRALWRIDNSIKVDDRGPWVVHVNEATALLQALVIGIAFILLSCVIGMVVLVSKTNLRLHFKAVSLLHMFGATDEYIIRQFQWNSAMLAGRGALAGVLAAASIFLAAVILSMRWESAILPSLHFTVAHIAVFLLLPLLTALIALIATRLTVESMLGHMH